MDSIIHLGLLGLLSVTAIAIIRLRTLFAAVMLSGIYSLLSAALLVELDAVDVALMEAALGAGISTVLMLGTLSLVGRKEKRPVHQPLLPLFVVIVTGAVLIYGTFDMPLFGAPDNPVHQHVAPRYLQESGREIGIPNVVTSVLASYRAYDTLGETTVIFTAVVGVLLLLSGGSGRPGSTHALAVEQSVRLDDRVILRVGAKRLIPFILLFGLYTQFHGDYGPGGGFQAAVIFASAFILYALVFGLADAQRVLSPRLAFVCAALGVLIFAGVGVATMAEGANFLDYHALLRDPQDAQVAGIMLVELGVLVTVFGVMITIFYVIAGRSRLRP
jgi:multicomponent Na+:H+ antiporter subunit B